MHVKQLPLFSNGTSREGFRPPAPMPDLSMEELSLAFLLLDGRPYPPELPQNLEMLEQEQWENLSLLLAALQMEQHLSTSH